MAENIDTRISSDTAKDAIFKASQITSTAIQIDETVSGLPLKLTKNTDITGATKTKITYDSKGLVTGGADLAETDLPTIAIASPVESSTQTTEGSRTIGSQFKTLIDNIARLFALVNGKVTKVASTDNAIVRFNGTTGEVKNSGVIIDDSGNVILNTTELNPTIKITTSGTTTQNTISTLDLTARGSNNVFNNVDIQSIGTNSLGGTLVFRTDNISGAITERMRIDSAGNVGIGVTPSAWVSSWKALQGTTAVASSTNGIYVMNNCYQASDGAKYTSSSYASFYQQYNGGHYWYTAPSGTAGNTITFTTAMTITNGGYIKLGSDAPAIKYKKLTGATGSTQGSEAQIVHGLNKDKILAVDVFVTISDGNKIPPQVGISGYLYSFIIGTSAIVIANSATSSANILSKPVTILITYEE